MKETDAMPGKSAEESLDPKDWESIRMLGHRILDDMIDYLEMLRDRPAWQHAPVDKGTFYGISPRYPSKPKEIYQEFTRFILPHQIGNNHPRFWGWVAGTGTVMGCLRR